MRTPFHIRTESTPPQNRAERIPLLLLSVLFCFAASFFAVAVAGDSIDESSEPELEVEEEQSIATALASRSVARLSYQAERMISRRELDEALAVIDYGLAIDPSYIPLWRLQAMALIELEQFKDAKTALSVCLLLNPNDVDARAMSLISDIREKHLDEHQRILKLVDGINDMDENLFLKVMARFACRVDFHKELPVFLQCWRRPFSGLEGIRKALVQYTCGEAEHAAQTLQTIHCTAATTAILSEVEAMLATELNPEDISSWKIEQGILTRSENTFTLISQPERQTFAWLRLSPEWRDVAVTVSFPDEGKTQNSLYLRYSSPESYIRITTKDRMVLIQERIPGVGLSTIHRFPLSQTASRPLHLVLRGNRLSVQANGENLIVPPLPISDAIASGRVALGSDNTMNAEEQSSTFPELRIRQITPNWQILSAEMSPQTAAALLLDEKTTGITIEADAFASKNRRRLSSILLDASSFGMTTIGELPAGESNVSALHRAVEHLPRVLANRIWTGVAFRPTVESDWTEFSAALSDARKEGLAGILILDENTAPSLAAFEGELWADWLCLDTQTPLPDSVSAALAKRYIQSIHRNESDTSRFSQ